MNDSYPLPPLPIRKFELQEWLIAWIWFLPPLVMVALVSDLFTPFLIWKGVIPGAARWISELMMLTVCGLTFLQMLQKDRIPVGFIVIIGCLVVGTTVSIFEGQQWQATAWGSWLMFKYPLLAIYTSLYSRWSKGFAKRFFFVLMGLLAFQVLFQIVQFALGESPGDDLAGTFGWHGVSQLAMFLGFAVSLAFGYWLATENLLLIGIAVGIGGVSSILGEMKIFLIIIPLMALVSVGILVIQKGKIGQAFLVILAIAIGIPIFAVFYNTLVADAMGSTRLEEYLNSDTTEQYLQQVFILPDGVYYFGRGFALEYAWDHIQRDSTTLLMGYGIGARADSEAMGILGSALRTSYYGRTTGGSTAMIMIQETGLLGLAIFSLFILFLMGFLYDDIRHETDIYELTLRYGLMVFSLFWPVWIWYDVIWLFGVAMILYWTSIGYTVSRRFERTSISNKQRQYSTDFLAYSS